MFVPFWTSADERLLVEAASGVIHAAPNQAEPETNQEWNLSHRKGSLLLGSPTEHYLYVTGLLERVGTGLLGTIGYVVLPTGVSTDVSRDIV